MENEIKERRYNNGFEVVMIPKPDFIKKFAGIIVDFGASDLDKNEANLAGVAHFLEHKLFAKKNGDISTEFDENEADVNAFTSYNETMYYASFIKHDIANIKLLFKLISQPFFTPENVDKEREIIIQELKMYQDDPIWALNQTLMKHLFSNNILADDIAGSEKSLAKITPSNLFDIWKRYYQAQNMKLVLAGNFDFDQVISQIDQEIKDLPVGKAIWTNARLINDFDTKSVQPNKILLTGKTTHPRFGIGLKLPNFKNFLESNDIVQMIVEIMLESKLGSMSNLYQELHNTGMLQQEPSIGVSYTRQGNYAKIFGQSDQFEIVIDRILEILKADDTDEEIFQMKRRELIAKSIKTIDRVEALAIEVAESRLENRRFFDDLDEFQKISFEQFKQIGQAIIQQSEVSVVILKGAE